MWWQGDRRWSWRTDEIIFLTIYSFVFKTFWEPHWSENIPVTVRMILLASSQSFFLAESQIRLHSDGSFLQLVVRQVCNIWPHQWAQHTVLHGVKGWAAKLAPSMLWSKCEGRKCVYTLPHQVAYLKPECAWEISHNLSLAPFKHKQ